MVYGRGDTLRLPCLGSGLSLLFPPLLSILIIVIDSFAGATSTSADNMTGFLIPDDYKFNKPSIDDMNIASIAWGFSLGVCIFTGAKGMRQTVKSWKRGRRTNIYLIMLWTEWASSTIMSAITWFYLRGHIPPSFAIFFVIGMLHQLKTGCR